MLTENAVHLFRAHLKDEAKRLGHPLSDGQLDSLAAHYRLLARWNRRVRLVGGIEPRRAASELFADSLAVCAFVDSFLADRKAGPMIDIGAGAGFPGIPILLAHPERVLTVVDANAKKASFLKILRRHLGLPDLAVTRGRAETLGHTERFRERFGLAFCRAVGAPAAACELSIPFLRAGGSFILQTGDSCAPDARIPARALAELGASIDMSASYELEHPSRRRMLVRIVKTGPTPALYPRDMLVIRKRPLA